MEAWKRKEPTTVTKVGWRTIVTKTFEMPDGSVAEFQTKDGERGHCVATIALTKRNEVIVARQFRPGPEKIMDELPGGGAEEGEDFKAAAERELIEETGYKAQEMIPVGDVYKDAYTNTIWHYFLATGCEKNSGQQLDVDEHITCELISIAQLFDNARSGKMTDVEAVFLAVDNLYELMNGQNSDSHRSLR